MSIRRMAAIWDISEAIGNDRLVILAIADNADDDGFCWPSLDYIAAKCRLSQRTVIRSIETLEKSGDLWVEHNRRRGNRYLVTPGLSDDEVQTTLCKKFGLALGDAMLALANIRKAQAPSSQNPDSTSINCQSVSYSGGTDRSITDNLSVQNCQIDTSELTNCHIRTDNLTHQNCQIVTSELTTLSVQPSITIKEPKREERAEPELSPNEKSIIDLYTLYCGMMNGLRHQEILSMIQQFPDPNVWENAFQLAEKNASYPGRWKYALAVVTNPLPDKKPGQKQKLPSGKENQPAVNRMPASQLLDRIANRSKGG